MATGTRDDRPRYLNRATICTLKRGGFKCHMTPRRGGWGSPIRVDFISFMKHHNTATITTMRVPMKPATDSDLKPAAIPI